MRTRFHTNWALLSALLALAIGLLMKQAAAAENDRWLERTALLLIIYGLAIVGLHAWPTVLTWWMRIVRAIQTWRSSLIHAK
jgi:hypothetical protein